MTRTRTSTVVLAFLALLVLAGPTLAVGLSPPAGIPLAASSFQGSSGNASSSVYRVAGTHLDPLRNASAQDPSTQGTAGMAAPASLLPWTLPLVAAGGLVALVHRSVRRLDREGETEGAEGGAGKRSAGGLRGWPPRAGLTGVLALGRDAAGRGDYPEAVRWFETAIAVKPNLPVAHTCLGMCLSGLQRDDEALEAFRAAIELDPKDALPRYQLARTQARLGSWDDVLETLAPVLKDVPDLRDAARGDPSFRPLLDHPRFLALLGDL